jgi:hypothetical protein
LTAATRVEPLARVHDLESFSCGDDELDRWLYKSARPTGGSGESRTHLWIDDQDCILGFFALAPAVFVVNEMTDRQEPAILLAKFGLAEHVRGLVDEQGGKYSQLLLLEAFDVALRAHALIGGRHLVVDARRLKVVRFYQESGFDLVDAEPRPDGEITRLSMKMSAIRDLLA